MNFRSDGPTLQNSTYLPLRISAPTIVTSRQSFRFVYTPLSFIKYIRQGQFIHIYVEMVYRCSFSEIHVRLHASVHEEGVALWRYGDVHSLCLAHVLRLDSVQLRVS